MAAVHHNTIKKAAKLGVKVWQREDGVWCASNGDRQVELGMGADAQKVLTETIRELEAESRPAKRASGGKPKKRRKARKPRDEDDEEGEDGDEEQEEGRSVVKKKYKMRYKPHKSKCGDDISRQVSAHVSYKDEDKKLRTDNAKLKRFAIANGCWDPKYQRLNGGMKRMNIVNRLRALIRKGHEVIWAA